MTHTNHYHSDPDHHWEDITTNAPEIPKPNEPIPEHADWHELGIHEWNLNVVIGKSDDGYPNVETARHALADLEDLTNRLDADQLRAYLNGIRHGQRDFMWHGL